MFKTLLLLFAFSIALRSEVLDRVAISIGYRPITELEIDEELRVAALLSHKPVLHDHSARHDAADRLVQQFLIEREMQVSRYPAPTPPEVDAYLRQVENDFGGSSNLDAALKTDDLDRPTLLHHLAVQLAILRFVDIRFRPEFSVSDADVRTYLEREPAASSLDPAALRRQILEKRTDDALAVWLAEARKQFNIVYLDKSLQ